MSIVSMVSGTIIVTCGISSLISRRRINGIIDFGVAELGDPAIDYACIISALGESFLRRMAHFYPAIMEILDRARFRAGALELEWALHGIRSNDVAWWLAHMGGARDVMPFGT